MRKMTRLGLISTAGAGAAALAIGGFALPASAADSWDITHESTSTDTPVASGNEVSAPVGSGNEVSAPIDAPIGSGSEVGNGNEVGTGTDVGSGNDTGVSVGDIGAEVDDLVGDVSGDVDSLLGRIRVRSLGPVHY